MDKYTETTTRSWTGRIRDAFMGILVGIVLFIGSFFLLSWNEGRSIDRINTLAEARDIVVEISADQPDPQNNGELVHLSGEATTDRVLSDPIFGVKEKALALHRKVVMYQWTEKQSTSTKTNMGGSETTETTYTYNKSWEDRLINSSNFKHPEGHKNPAVMTYRSQDFIAPDIHIGKFRLTQVFTDQLDDGEPYVVSEESYNAMAENLKKTMKINGDGYASGDPANPQIGDIQVSYSIVMPQDLSVIGRQSGNAIQSFDMDKGDISLLGYGNLSPDELFTQAESENRLITWALRAGGFVMMWAGLAMFLRPLSVIADVVPLVGSIVGMGTGFISGIISVILSTATIAIAWIVVRPVFSLSILAAGIAATIAIIISRKRNDQAQASASITRPS